MLKRYDIERVRGTHENWAVILIDTEMRMIAVVSDLGRWAHLWAAPDMDFRRFLVEMEDDPHYLHGALMQGRRDRLVYDGDATRALVREHVRERFADDPRALADEIQLLEDHAMWDEESFGEWIGQTQLRSAYDLRQTQPEPACMTFCTRVYARFVSLLRAELAGIDPHAIAARVEIR